MIKFLQPVFLLLLLPGAVLLWFRPFSRVLCSGLRALLYLLLILALAQPYFSLRRGGGLVMVVADQSASMPPGSKGQQEALIRSLHSTRGANDKVGVVSFAREAFVEHVPQETPFSGFAALHDPDASQLAAGLTSALNAIPAETPARIVVLSDGQFSGTDPRAVAGLASARGVAIDYRLMQRAHGRDLAITALEAPQELAPGAALLVTAWLMSPVAQTITYTLTRGTNVVAHGTRNVPRGRSSLIFRDFPASKQGHVYGYQLTINGTEADPVSENNTARFLVSINGVKPLLHIAPTRASHLGKVLLQGGVAVDSILAHQLDNRLQFLANYSGIILENIRADQLGEATQQTLRAWVQATGAGLLMTGGRNSFGSGGYYRAALEPILPVSLELRREHRAFSTAMAIALDRSGSMAMPLHGGRTKMDLANLGTVEALTLLSDYDEIAVLAVDTQPHIILPLMSVTRARQQRQQILQIESMGGGIYVYEALVAALKQLQGSQAGVKHIILFADAADAEQPGEYQTLLQAARDVGITASVIGLGTVHDGDAQLLQDIAKLGGGRCLFTDDALEIPRLFAQDTFIVAHDTWITNAVVPHFTTTLAEIGFTPPVAAPALGGYNLCYAKPGSGVAALTHDENRAPLLAWHHWGLGRVIAFTGEVDGAGAGSFANWEAAGDFYCALARYISATPFNDEGVIVQQQLIAGGLRVILHLDPERPELRRLQESHLNLLRRRTGALPQNEVVSFTWRDASTLMAEVALDGSETLLASVAYPHGVANLPPVCLPYSPEFAPDGLQDGRDLLAQLARQTGGVMRADIGQIWDAVPRGTQPLLIAPWLYLLAGLVFLVEIFERRTGWLSARHRQPNEPSFQASTPQGREVTVLPMATHTPKEENAPDPTPESPLKVAKRRARRRTETGK